MPKTSTGIMDKKHETGKVTNVDTPVFGSNIPKDNWQHRSKGIRCGTCMWFEEKIPNQKGQITKRVGECKKRAPTMTGFPVVWSDGWCGDHKLDENNHKIIYSNNKTKITQCRSCNEELNCKSAKKGRIETCSGHTKQDYTEPYYKIYLNRWTYYAIPRSDMPKVIDFLNKNSFYCYFKPGEGAKKVFLNKNLNHENNELAKK